MTQPEQESQRPGEASIAVDWAGASDKPLLHVNQFAAQTGVPARDGIPDGLYLLLGSVAPPLIFGKTNAEYQREIEALGSVPVTIHGRFHLSRARLSELIDVLTQAAQNYDAIAKASRDDATESKEA